MAVAQPHRPHPFASDRDYLHDLMQNHDDVELPAGAAYSITEQLVIPGSTRLWTDPNNPATLKRDGKCIHICAVNGMGIRIENLKFDWNFQNAWRDYNVCIGFAVHSWLHELFPPQPLGNIEIIGCRFIESGPKVRHPWSHETGATVGDVWCISLVPAIPQATISGVKILGCQSIDNDVQLTGNGGLHGLWDDVEIAYNVVRIGWSAGIAFTSRLNRIDGGATVWNNIRIHHNMIRHGLAYGIALGVDQNPNYQFSTMQLDNIDISDNLFHLSPQQQYPACILVRPGLDTQDPTGKQYTARNITVRRNVFSIRDSQDFVRSDNATNTPRLVSMSVSSPGNDLTFQDNIIDASRAATNYMTNPNFVAVTQSGNKYIDGRDWS